MHLMIRRPLCVSFVLFALVVLCGRPGRLVQAQGLAPGGFLEAADALTSRVPLTPAQIAAFMPAARGPFVFPAPFGTQAWRITNASDCGGTDCVQPVGYSYWRNLNNSTGSDTLYLFLGTDRNKGGAGPTLFSVNKVTGVTQNLGPLFDASSPYSWATGEGWYFSATRPTTLYVFSGAQLSRYDVLTHALSGVFDASLQFGTDKVVWQLHSSNDDTVHSFTLRQNYDPWAMLGCGVYSEAAGRYWYFPARGDYDECQIDKSGRYLLIKENVDGVDGEDNVIEDLATGIERIYYDRQGAGGHSDNGYGYEVGEDNFFAYPGSVRLYRFDQEQSDPSNGNGTLVWHSTDWNIGANHIAHENAVAGTPISQQYACQSNATRSIIPRANEVLCYRLDGSLVGLIVAPVMTDLNASGGGTDDYWKYPKGNLDVTGQYYIWTANLGSARLDAFLVRIPSQLLTSGTNALSVSITTPSAGATVSGTTALSATVSGNSGVASVQFKVDGNNVGGATTTAPFSVSWDSSTLPAGAHAITAEARDAAGDLATSAPISITTSNAVAAPSAPGSTPVVWTSLVNVVASGSTLTKTSGCDGCPDAGAVSQQQIASGDGYVEFTASETGTLRAIGLSSGNPGTSLEEIAFAMRLQSGDVEVRENGVYKADTGFVSGDLLRVSVVGGQVTYSRNGTVFYTSSVSPTYPLLVDTSLSSLNSTLANVVISGAGSTGSNGSSLTISRVGASNVSGSSATISWTTNAPADSQVEYGVTTAYGQWSPLNSSLVTTHRLALSGLSPGVTYHYRVRSRSLGASAVSGDYVLTTHRK